MLRLLLYIEVTSTFYFLLAFTIFPVNTIFGMSTHKDRYYSISLSRGKFYGMKTFTNAKIKTWKLKELYPVAIVRV